MSIRKGVLREKNWASGPYGAKNSERGADPDEQVKGGYPPQTDHSELIPGVTQAWILQETPFLSA